MLVSLCDTWQEQVGTISTDLTAHLLEAIDGVIRFRLALTPIAEKTGLQSSNSSFVVNTTSPSACAAVDQRYVQRRHLFCYILQPGAGGVNVFATPL